MNLKAGFSRLAAKGIPVAGGDEIKLRKGSSQSNYKTGPRDQRRLWLKRTNPPSPKTSRRGLRQCNVWGERGLGVCLFVSVFLVAGLVPTIMMVLREDVNSRNKIKRCQVPSAECWSVECQSRVKNWLSKTVKRNEKALICGICPCPRCRRSTWADFKLLTGCHCPLIGKLGRRIEWPTPLPGHRAAHSDGGFRATGEHVCVTGKAERWHTPVYRV